MRHNTKHVLEPDSTIPVPLDRFDRAVIEEALKHYAENEIEDDGGAESTKKLARYVGSYE